MWKIRDWIRAADSWMGNNIRFVFFRRQSTFKGVRWLGKWYIFYDSIVFRLKMLGPLWKCSPILIRHTTPLGWFDETSLLRMCCRCPLGLFGSWKSQKNALRKDRGIFKHHTNNTTNQTPSVQNTNKKATISTSESKLTFVISVGEHFIASPPSPSNNTRLSESNQASR